MPFSSCDTSTRETPSKEEETVLFVDLEKEFDLVIMAPTMEQLGRRVAEWRASLLGKRLKVNAGKLIAVVGILL